MMKGRETAIRFIISVFACPPRGRGEVKVTAMLVVSHRGVISDFGLTWGVNTESQYFYSYGSRLG